MGWTEDTQLNFAIYLVLNRTVQHSGYQAQETPFFKLIGLISDSLVQLLSRVQNDMAMKVYMTPKCECYL